MQAWDCKASSAVTVGGALRGCPGTLPPLPGSPAFILQLHRCADSLLPLACACRLEPDLRKPREPVRGGQWRQRGERGSDRGAGDLGPPPLQLACCAASAPACGRPPGPSVRRAPSSSDILALSEFPSLPLSPGFLCLHVRLLCRVHATPQQSRRLQSTSGT